MDIGAQASAFLVDYSPYLLILSWTILGIGVAQNLVYALQLPAAWAELRERSQAEDSESAFQLLISDVAMPISLVVPGYNEEATIVESVRSMLSLRYPDLEIIVVNDGSKDGTLQALIDAFQLQPVTRAHEEAVKHQPIRQVYGSSMYARLLVVDKHNGGKSDAINAGINLSRNPLFCVVDADSLLEIESLLSSVRPFMEDPRHMIAVGGTIRVLNGCVVKNGQVIQSGLPRKFLPLVQYMEYIRAYLMARLAWSRWGILTLISGAFGIFRRSVAVEVGGFTHGTVGEDYELIVKMHKHMRNQDRVYSLRYVPEPVCWTEAPETLKVLSNQRKRWQRGALEVFFRHRDMLLNPRYGKVGMLGFLNNLIIDVLGPIAEVLGYILMPLFWIAGVFSFDFFLAYVALFFAFGVFISVCSLILEELELRRVPRASDLALLLGVAIVENFGYRQLTNVWRIIGWWEFLRGKTSWGTMTRKGFGPKPGSEAAMTITPKNA
ncbi:glycosyl transferase family 2 family protein [Asticcacaulis biprosthecium C19]|uniref:Glycosyl transferase family 2 family protein n=1 Tax=Asticcacaulis biprosthecium C19 TaxID=715226 RepID=F4QI30_9CAUL|nr:glycosyltransferase family 2 protein [Asticcacaulis biprosthecium]EGF92897.1 glycosyl transferase family 2 family protein [Asticcacaulis biprosthecium C19]